MCNWAILCCFILPGIMKLISLEELINQRILYPTQHLFRLRASTKRNFAVFFHGKSAGIPVSQFLIIPFLAHLVFHRLLSPLDEVIGILADSPQVILGVGLQYHLYGRIYDL